jgi:hypothetical protein
MRLYPRGSVDSSTRTGFRFAYPIAWHQQRSDDDAHGDCDKPSYRVATQESNEPCANGDQNRL